jgi:predicted TIM-barrel fold metal-dependent hydrolase
VSSKLATEVPSLNDPAVDKILEFAGEAGLLALIHCDMDTPFRKEGERPTFLAPMKAMLRRHPRTTIIWAHLGLGRVIRPVKDQMAIVVGMLSDPAYDHVCFDLSWDELAKYLETTPQTAERVASVLTRYPDRFLFGTDEIGPTDQRKYMHVYELYQPLWKLLDRRVKEQVCKGNFERLFDRARHQVRAWESARGLFAPRATPHRHHVSKAPAHAHVH